VVSVANGDGKLLPGMTATVEFLIGSVSDVMMVPNAALRFRPPEEVMAKIREQMQARMQAAGNQRGEQAPGQTNGQTNGAGGAQTGGSTNAGSGRRGGAAGGQQSGGNFAAGGGRGAMVGTGSGRGRNSMAMLWHLDAEGNLTATRVRTGITDGQKTQIEGKDIKEGMQIVVGIIQTQQNSTNAFQPTQPQGQMRRPGF
jgi:HlyD family secretion protein